MDLWMKIGSAILLGTMLLLIFPQVKNMVENSPKAEEGDWSSFILPLALVAGFVALLMWLV